MAVLCFTGTPGFAQGLDGPVNLPPTSFDGQGFNDDAGCAFMRAGVSGTTVWVPRVDQTRTPICGLAPTFAAPAPVVAAVPVPVGTPDPIAPEPVMADALPSDTGAPMATVASLTTAPRMVAAAPVVVVAPVVMAAPAERRMTLAQACAETAATGRILTNSATGQPVVCPSAAPVVLAAVETAPTMAAEPPSMTLSAACAASQDSGIRYINAATGRPIDCSVMTGPVDNTLDALQGGGPVPASNPTGLVAPYSGPPRGYEPVWTDGRLNPNRGFPPIATSQYQVLPLDGRNSGGSDFLPLSRDQMAARMAVAPAVTDRVSTQSAAQVMPANPVATATTTTAGHRFVQVGTYGDPANADRAAAALRGLGLPVGFATITRNGAALQIVAAGPFASAAEMQAALQAARAAGYGDAFTRP